MISSISELTYTSQAPNRHPRALCVRQQKRQARSRQERCRSRERPRPRATGWDKSSSSCWRLQTRNGGWTRCGPWAQLSNSTADYRGTRQPRAEQSRSTGYRPSQPAPSLLELPRPTQTSIRGFEARRRGSNKKFTWITRARDRTMVDSSRSHILRQSWILPLFR